MIFWFSGTGNSAFVARELARRLAQRLVAVGQALTEGQFDYTLDAGEPLGFVFPTYCWGPAPVVLQLMRQLSISGLGQGTYCFMVTTCGDDVGQSAQIFAKAVAAMGGLLKAAFSVQMPNNYVCLPGFGVDPDALRDTKLQAAPNRIASIAQRLASRDEVTDVVPGGWAWAKSRIIRPWFLRHMMTDRRFHVDAARCTHCGKCARVCPMHNILLTDPDRQPDASGGLPSWQGRCAMCLACLHHCPTQAIDYGTASRGKPRYHL